MQTLSSSQNTNEVVKETWSKPEVSLLSVTDDTLGLGIDPDKILHFFMGS